MLAILTGAGGQTALANESTDRIILTSQWRTAETSNTVLKFNSKYNGEWLELDWGFRIPDRLDEDNYASVYSGFELPQIIPDLEFDLDYRWDDTYQIWTAGAAYHMQPSSAWEWGVGYGGGYRDGLDTGGSPYRYRFRKADAKLDFTQNPWSYSAGLSYTAKDYPVTRYYTSERLALEQTIRWQPKRSSALYLSYLENAADYPCDESLTRSYFKTQWLLGGRYRFDEPWDLNWEVSSAQRNKGLNETSRTMSLDLSLRTRLGKGTTILRGGLADRDYSTGATPGEDDPETDLKSRTEQKTTLTWSYPLGETFASEVGWFWIRLDYDGIFADDSSCTGWFTTLTWKPKPFQWVLRAAPWGDLNRRVGFYQVQVEYILP